jgi:uncharacterized membrane protein
MLILGTTTDKIQVTLSSAITTNQLDCIATYKDITTSAYSGSAPILVTTNNTTNVDLVPAPGSNTQRIVDFISIYNNDTANATVIVTINRNGSIGILFKCTLKTSESLVYSEGAGWNIHSNNGSPKQFLSYDTSLNSNKNYFKNPAFSVIQSSASGTLANSLVLPTASLGYLGETEWCIAAAGGTPAYAFSAVGESVTFTGAASTTAIYLLQRLESRDTNRIKSKTVTFSCEISNSLLTSVIWEVFRPTTSDDVHGTIATPTQTLIASGTFTVNSTLTRYSATFALPDLASRGLEVRLRVGAQTSGTWVIARLQLEEGSTATDFNCDDFGKELRKCLRYYRQSYGLGIATGSTTDFNNRVSIFGGVAGSISRREKFDIDMFSVPVTNTWDINGNSNSVITISSGGISTTRTPSRTQTTKTLFVSATTSDVIIQFHYAASAHIP